MRRILMLVAAACLIAGCGPTKMTTTSDYAGTLPQPTMIVVYNFAVAPNEVELDEGIEADITRAKDGTPRTLDEMAIGRQVSEAFAKKLVAQLQNDGYVVLRAADAHINDNGNGNVLTIKGQFISIDEGNRTERVMIGFGMGRTDVRTAVQIAERMPQTSGAAKVQLVESVTADAKSGYKPGMAETAGAAAMAGHVGTGIAVGAGLAVGSEAFGANVDADADRSAKQIAGRIKLIYQARGWQTY